MGLPSWLVPELSTSSQLSGNTRRDAAPGPLWIFLAPSPEGQCAGRPALLEQEASPTPGSTAEAVEPARRPALAAAVEEAPCSFLLVCWGEPVPHHMGKRVMSAAQWASL